MALLPSVWLSFSTGLIGLGVFDIFAFFILVVLVWLRDGRYSLRANILLLLGYSIGAVVFIFTGDKGAGLYWIFTIPPLASLLLGLRWGLLFLGLNVITMVGIGALVWQGSQLIPDLLNFSLLGWIVYASNFVATNFMVTLPLGALLDGLLSSAEQIKSADQKAVNTEIRYRSLFEGMLNGVMYGELILDAKGQPIDFRYLETNKAFRDLTGLGDVIGKKVTEIFPDFRKTNPEALQRYFEAVVEGKSFRYESHFEGLDSWFSIFLYGIEGGKFVLVFDNVTEQKQREMEIESISRFPRENPYPVLRVGADLRIQFANDAGKLLLEHWSRQIGEKVPEKWEAYVSDSLVKGEVVQNEVVLKDGVVSLAVVPIREQDYVNIYGLDITARVQAEEDLRLSEQKAQGRLNRLRALRAIDIAITGKLDPESVLDAVLEETLALVEADAVAILLLDADGWLDFRGGKGFISSEIEKSHLHIGEGIAGRSAQDQELHWVEDIRASEAGFTRQKLAKKENFVSYRTAPLITKGNLLGILETYNRSKNELDKEGREFLVAIAGQASIAIENAQLFQDLESSKGELEDTYNRTLEGWVGALDLRDNETSGHTRRVSSLTQQLAKKVGIPQSQLPEYWRGALLHDVGKMAVPDNILLKAGPLDADEWVIMKQHPIYAFEWLQDLAYLEKALDIPYCHHEKWDGTGYPRGLKGEKIPLAARIFAVADVFDALTSDRPYRKAWTRKKAIKYIEEQSGHHFDPKVVQAFLELIRTQ